MEFIDRYGMIENIYDSPTSKLFPAGSLKEIEIEISTALTNRKTVALTTDCRQEKEGGQNTKNETHVIRNFAGAPAEAGAPMAMMPIEISHCLSPDGVQVASEDPAREGRKTAQSSLQIVETLTRGVQSRFLAAANDGDCEPWLFRHALEVRVKDVENFVSTKTGTVAAQVPDHAAL